LLGQFAPQPAYSLASTSAFPLQGSRGVPFVRSSSISSSRFLVITCFRSFQLRVKSLSENVPTARAVIIKDAGHFPHIEKPETVNELLSEWLEEKVTRS
jgi:pimeloyl-ACP methyl ester carboxylesterase